MTRSSRYLARVDAHLPTLAGDAARRGFLAAQFGIWERRYARFVATGGASEEAAPCSQPIDASDFLLTISGLGRRLDQVSKRPTQQVQL